MFDFLFMGYQKRLKNRLNVRSLVYDFLILFYFKTKVALIYKITFPFLEKLH